jgi:acyl-coenzyme A thioesterase PaaI-like protein
MFKKLQSKPWFFKLLINSYFPYLGAGVKVTRAELDDGVIEVCMPLTKLNKNYVGTHFGGSLYAMVDPFFMFLLLHKLGNDYIVWDKAANIDFVAPGRGLVRAVMQIDDAEIATIRQLAADGKAVYRTYPVEVLAEDGSVVAKVDKVLYIRLKRQNNS